MMELITKSLIIISFVSYSLLLNGQTINTWTHMNDFEGEARRSAVSFVVNNKGYVGTGQKSTGELTQDFWEYNAGADTWQQVHPAPGLPRYAAIGFAIGNKGYMGTGDVGGNLGEIAGNDFYEYDPTLNIWNPKLGVGFQGRKSATAFVIGNKGYVTGGYLKSGTTVTYDNSLYEFDPNGGPDGSWTPRPNFPGISRASAGGFTVNNIGYITGGANFIYVDPANPSGYGAIFRDLWSYDPTTQQWTSMNTYPTSLVPTGTASDLVECFAIGNKGYIIGTNYFLEYDPSQNSFSSKGIPSSSSHRGSASFNLCNFGYFATGTTGTVGSKNVYKYLSAELDFAGASLVCNANSTFNVNTIAAGSNITWSTSSNLSTVSGQGTPSYTVNTNANGPGWVRMDVTTPCGISYYFQHNIYAGNPIITSLKVSATGEPTDYRFTAPQVDGATYNWYVNNAYQANVTGNTFDLYFPCNSTKTVKCTVSSSCVSGFSNSITKTGECSRASAFTLSPNPSNHHITIQAASISQPDQIELHQPIDEIRILDFTGVIRTKISYDKANSATIDVTGLTPGIYFVEIWSNGEVEKQRLQIR